MTELTQEVTKKDLNQRTRRMTDEALAISIEISYNHLLTYLKLQEEEPLNPAQIKCVAEVTEMLMTNRAYIRANKAQEDYEERLQVLKSASTSLISLRALAKG